MKKRIKKAFTLVELLVVIAILAVLSTVAVVGYNSFTEKAQLSNDVGLVKQMNNVLEGEEISNGKNKTFHEARADLMKEGIDLSIIKTDSKDYKFAWDSVADRVVLLNNEGILEAPENYVETADYNLFVVANSVADIDAKFSVYLADKFPATDIEVSNGVDVGNNVNININYNDDAEEKVILNTNGGTLEVNNAKATVNHYGFVDEATIIEVASSSYDEYGVANYIEIQKGHIFVKNNGIVNVIFATGPVKVDKESNSIIGSAYTTVDGNTQNGNVSLEKATIEDKDNIKENSAFIGKGTKEAPYSIYNAYGLITLSKKVAAGNSYADQYFALLNDIDMKDVLWGVENGENTINCIGTITNPFSGSFNGQGHKINNLSNGGRVTSGTYTSPTSHTTGNIFGLFGYTGGNVEIKDLKLNIYADVPDGAACAGLISNANGNLTITNVTLTGNLNAKEKTSGFVYAFGGGYTATLTNCVNEMNISAKERVSGFIGFPQGSSTINYINCQNKGNIMITKNSDGSYDSTTKYGVAAGFTSHSNGATINYDEKCANTGTIDAPLAANYQTYAGVMSFSNGTWTKGASAIYETAVGMKGIIMTESSKAFAMALENTLNIPHGLDGIYYQTNNVYVIEFSSSIVPKGTARYTAEEWADLSTNFNYADGAADTIANNSTPLIIKLNDDLTWDRTLKLTGSGRPIIIDLNNHTLTVSATMFSGQNGYDITYKNGEIQVNDSIEILSITGKGEVTYENVTGNYNQN